MTYFVCGQKDLEGHGRSLTLEDREATDLMQAALNDYEAQGMILQHVVPPKWQPPKSYGVADEYPVFIFRKTE